MPKLPLLTVVLLLVFCLNISTADAQESAIIQATATVLPTLSIIGTNNLQFGSVTPGINKSVTTNTVGFAGEWDITGFANAELSLTFQTPDSLILIDSTVGLPVTFTNTDAAYEDGSGGGQLAPAGIISPLGPSTLRLSPSGSLIIWIGGTATPRISQTSGDYSANVVLTVAYTGG